MLTAAHCLYDLGSLIVSQRVIVSLGRRNLHLATPNSQEFFAYRLIVHKDYNQNAFNNDIAIIRLDSEVSFTTYVQPICLWDARRVALDEIVGRNGAVVGWGLNERDELPSELDLAYMPVVESMDCLLSDPDFFGSLLNHRTYCAGFRNGRRSLPESYSRSDGILFFYSGTGACNGDSGGGMYFVENESYTLRGIVSQTRARSGEENFCDSRHYVVFTDTASYSNWIRDNIK